MRDKLFDYQREGVDWIVTKKGRCILADDPGLGKTAQTIVAASELDAFPWLVACPASLIWNWEREIRLWAPDLAADPEAVHVVTASANYAPAPETKVVVMSYDLATNLKGELSEFGPKTVILDEAHLIKNYETLGARALVPLCRAARHSILLTGTPILNRPRELWTLLAAIRATQATFESFHRFGVRFCGAFEEKIWNPYTRTSHTQWNYNGQSNLDELHEILRQVMLRRKDTVLGTLPNLRRVKYAAGSEAMKVNEKLREKVRAALTKTFGDERKALAVLKQGRQKAIVDDLFRQYRLVGKKKIDLAASLLVETAKENGPVVCFGHHEEVLLALLGAADDAGFSTALIDGGVTPKNRQKTVDRFQAGEIDVLLCSTTATNAGITLTRACEGVVVEMPYSSEIAKQIEGRLRRIGQTRDCRFRYLVREGTVDDYLWKLMGRKAKTFDRLIDGQKDTSFDRNDSEGEEVENDPWDVVRAMIREEANSGSLELWPEL